MGLVAIATLFFACQDTISKYLLETYDVPLVAAVRYIVHALLMVAILAPRHGPSLVTVKRPVLVMVRSLCLVVATLFMALALQRLPVAETTSIVYIAPIIVVLLARPLLGEEIGFFGWLGALLGFLGVLLIIRPGGGLDPVGVGFALANVCVTVAYYMLSRFLSGSERTLALLFYSALAGAICFGITMPWYWFGTMPTTLDLALFASLGVFAGLGHFCYTAANRFCTASMLAPVSYTHLIWAGALGWLVFAQAPDTLGLIGMAVVGLAGVGTALRSRIAPR
jgi:drug/metabolite transporter (DMT)-like permease